MYQQRYINHTLNTIRINGKTLSTIIKLSFTVNNYFQLIGLVLGQRPLGAILHSSNEPGELSQWFCHDDSTINIVVIIIFIIIITPPGAKWKSRTADCSTTGSPGMSQRRAVKWVCRSWRHQWLIQDSARIEARSTDDSPLPWLQTHGWSQSKQDNK